MNKKLLWLLAITSMLSAGNIYYVQPLLAEVARFFDITEQTAGLLPVFTQSGYVAGLLFLSPLGDIIDRKKLILILIVIQIFALLGFATTTNFAAFLMVAFTLGLSSIAVQIILPLVASLSSASHRSKNLGFIISTALIGILLSRTISGWSAKFFGWRSIFYAASIMLAVLTFVLYKLLPSQEKAESHVPYGKLLLSLGTLWKAQPKLRSIAINGAFLYAALGAFWTSLVFTLENNFHLSSASAGSFGFIGALGALSASFAGRFIARHGSRRVIDGCMFMMAASFVIMGVLPNSMLLLILGVIFLDIGAQAATVTNQNELYTLQNTAHARLNTIYKIIYFIGGACGSFASAMAWKFGQWPLVCAVGFTFVLLAYAWEHLTVSRTPFIKPNLQMAQSTSLVE